MAKAAASGPPGKIMIVRHGEKPGKNPGKDGPFGVKQSGEQDEKSLLVIGWQRAGALNAFFAPYGTKPANKAIATPDCIYAADPKGESKRPCETVSALAAWLGYEKGTAKFNVQYDIGGGEADLVKSVLGQSGVVLVCWEHDNIMPNIVGAINKTVPIANYGSIPGKWPDVFYLVWVFDLDGAGKSYTWTSVNQNLMAGDVK